jgi:hypothetical protein
MQPSNFLTQPTTTKLKNNMSYVTYNNREAYKIKTTNGRRSLESRVCGMRIDLAEKVLRGEIGINTAIKMTKQSMQMEYCYYEYHIAQQDQILWFKFPYGKDECTDGRSWVNASDENMTRRGHQG